MKKAFLSKGTRTLFLILGLFCLMAVGSVLIKSYNTTAEKHLFIGIELLSTNASQALVHFKLAQKSPHKSVQRLALMKLASLYHHGGIGVEQNIPKAVYYYEQLAREDDPKALYFLALFYDAGDKVPENREKAMDYMKKAAMVLPEAKYALGVWMERGYYGKVDMKQVVQLYTEAANDGVVNAMKSLISIYHGGYDSFQKNIKLEHFWRSELKKKATK